jgi:hypothetical protein
MQGLCQLVLYSHNIHFRRHAGGMLEFDGDYSAVRQTQAYIPSASNNATAALEASLELAAHRQLSAVLLPADTR